MKQSVSPRMVALLVLASLSPLGAQNFTSPTAPSSPKHSEPSSSVTPSKTAALPAVFGSAVPIPRAIPVVTAAPKAKLAARLEVRREPVSVHPITVKNGPQPYIVDPDSLQKGLTLISELYRKSTRR